MLFINCLTIVQLLCVVQTTKLVQVLLMVHFFVSVQTVQCSIFLWFANNANIIFLKILFYRFIDVCSSNSNLELNCYDMFPNLIRTQTDNVKA